MSCRVVGGVQLKVALSAGHRSQDRLVPAVPQKFKSSIHKFFKCVFDVFIKPVIFDSCIKKIKKKVLSI